MRACTCRHLTEALRDDPRLRLVPLAARALWLLLADALARMPEPGVFSVGSALGSVREVAMLVSAEETEVEPALQTLLESALLVRREVDGALALPDPVPAQRAAQARENGRSGGRPRRGETADQARQRRAQGHLPLAIEGGIEKPTETETRTDASRARGLLSSSSEEDSKQAAREVSQLAGELAELARFDPARSLWNAGPVSAWLAQGATPELLRGAIRRVAARSSYVPPAGFGYFNGAVADALRQRPQAAVAAPVDEATAADSRRYTAAIQAWVAGGMFGKGPERPAHLRVAA